MEQLFRENYEGCDIDVIVREIIDIMIAYQITDQSHVVGRIGDESDKEYSERLIRWIRYTEEYVQYSIVSKFTPKDIMIKHERELEELKKRYKHELMEHKKRRLKNMSSMLIKKFCPYAVDDIVESKSGRIVITEIPPIDVADEKYLDGGLPPIKIKGRYVTKNNTFTKRFAHEYEFDVFDIVRKYGKMCHK